VTVTALERGRAAFDARAWGRCVAELGEADTQDPLDFDDLRRLSIGAFLAGDDELSEAVLVRGFRHCVEHRRWTESATCAFWLSFMLAQAGEHGRSSGWLERCRQLVAEHDLQDAEPGLAVAALEAHLMAESGRFDEALVSARRTASQAQAVGAVDVRTLALLDAGHCLLGLRRNAEAVRVYDEVMLEVTGGMLSPPVTGMAYCGVIAACMDLRDLRRAREWTAALSSWADDESGVPYRGFCLVHRAQIMAMGGSWADARAEARSACDVLAEPALGLAWYALGELHRLTGSYADAEDAYRTANSLGQQPEPGLARLRLAQGRTDAALATVRRLYAEGQRTDRADVLVAYAEVVLAAGDLEAARAASEELTALAGAQDSPMLTACAQETAAALLGAEGASADALPLLRRAWAGWRELGMPYDAARVRVRIGDCCRALGDDSSALMEYDAARATFEQLGARPDVERVDRRTGAADRAPGGLTGREVEVLRLVAAGHGNREIAHRLFLSEKTVARHLSNIYGKLGCGSRGAATAWAHDHGLV
jgi:DNA-binding CsgD family transcriptional regulator/tetratricopeptide (TPR) repeat protein